MAKELKYQRVIRPDLAEDFAKANCKKCYGRGLLTFQDVDMPTTRYEYCSCVKKRIKLYRTK